MDFIVELLIELLVEVFVSLGLGLQLLLSLGLDAVRESFRRRATANYQLALWGYLGMGIVAGCVSLFVYSERLSANDVISTLGVVLNPILAGVFMWQVGQRRSERGKESTFLTTFWGGFCFAAGFGGVRYVYLMWLG